MSDEATTTPDWIRDRVQARMAEMKMTPYAVCRETGVNQTTLGRWLNGHTSIGSDKLQHILNALGIRLEW